MGKKKILTQDMVCPPKSINCTKWKDMAIVHQRIKAPEGKPDPPAGYMYREVSACSLRQPLIAYLTDQIHLWESLLWDDRCFADC